MKHLLPLLLLLVLSVQFALAQPAPAGKVWVIAIGVGKYTHNFSALRAAPEGARNIARALHDARPNDTTVYTLTTDEWDPLQQPTKENVVDKITSLKVGPADSVIVYFCGHGVECGGKPYLLLMNVSEITNQDNLEAGSIEIAWLRNKLNALKCKERLLWLDACRVDALQASGAGNGQEHAQPYTETMQAAATLNVEAGGAVTFHGCQPRECVYYSKDGPSFFTTALVEGLRGGLRGETTDAQGRITMALLARYVQRRVPELLATEYPDAAQHPALTPAEVPADAFVLCPAPGVIALPRFAGVHGETFADIVFTRLQERRELNLVERDQLSGPLSELKLQDSGITDNKTAQKLGEMVNARYVLLGRETKADDEHALLSVHLVEVASGQLVNGVAADCTVNTRDFDTWRPALQGLTEDLLKAMRVSGLTIHRNSPDQSFTPDTPDNKVNRAPGSLRVESDPAGAQVFLGGDDQPLGVTPLTLDNLPAGKTIISVRRAGYGSRDDTVLIAPGRLTTFTATLPALQGALLIKSVPPGARVTLDGQPRGVTTDAGLKLIGLDMATRHKLTVELDDYQPWTGEAQVVFNTTKTVTATLAPLPGTLRIATVPAGAQVTLDGQPLDGVTPLTLKNLAAGAHVVRVALAGYAPQAWECTLAPHGQDARTFTLAAIEKAQIEVKSTPPGATITVNGVARGTTPALITLDEIGEEATEVKVTVAGLEGYQVVRETVTLKIGEQHTFDFTLPKVLPKPVPPPPAPGKINPKDGAELILIPAGEFLMGSAAADNQASPTEKPQHTVYLDAYYIYKNEVTVAQYRQFCIATGHAMPEAPQWGLLDDHPVVNVSWDDASAYAQWAGVCLPTEAQWEKAARGGDGRVFPWGNTWDAGKCSNSVGDLNPGKTSPVGSFVAGASPYGVQDMAGNVWQWCEDWYDEKYYQNTPARNPIGPDTGMGRVLRGGCWGYDNPGYLRAAYRGGCDPTHWGYVDGVGFRCASVVP